MAEASYRIRDMKSLLSPTERKLFAKLSTPQKIQDFLDTLPINFPKAGQAIRSPRGVLAHKKAHCMEGAVLAAAALAFHGKQPLLLDLRATDDDYDHVVALFKENGLWGAISKTNHPVLRYRDPVYKTVRELALSYFHEYFLPDQGPRFRKKTLRDYSAPFDLSRFKPERWVTAKNIDWLAEKLDDSPHFPILPKKAVQNLRKASLIELKASRLREWTKGDRKKYSPK